MTELHIPYEAAVPLAAFLWGKSLSPDYPNGGNVQDIALDLLRKTAPLIVAAELERLAEDVGEPASAQILQRAAELRDTGTQAKFRPSRKGKRMTLAEDRARDKARQDVVIQANKRAVKVSSCLTSIPYIINIWSGYDYSRNRTLEARDQCGQQAVDMLTEAVAELTEARDLLAAAVRADDDPERTP